MWFNSWEMHIFEFLNYPIPMTFPHALEYIYTHLRWNYHHHCGLVVKALAVGCEVLSSIPWRAELQGLITPVKRAQSGASLDSGVATHWNQTWASRVWAISSHSSHENDDSEKKNQNFVGSFHTCLLLSHEQAFYFFLFMLSSRMYCWMVPWLVLII